MLIFSVFVVLVVVFLCCYVVKLGKAQKTETKKKHPQKSGSTSGHFLQDKVMVACAKVIAFFFLLFGCFFACWSKNTIKIGFLDDFQMLIFSFFGQKSKVN